MVGILGGLVVVCMRSVYSAHAAGMPSPGPMRPPSATASIPSDELGARIRDLRQTLGLSQADLAARIGVTRGTVQNWEHGRTGITWDSLAALARELKASEDWLRLGDVLTAMPSRDGQPSPDELLAAIATALPRLEAKLDALLRAVGRSPEQIEDEAAAAVDGASSLEVAQQVARMRAAGAASIALLAAHSGLPAEHPARAEAPGVEPAPSARPSG